MHSLTIVFGPSPVPWVLLFKTEEAAKAAQSVFRKIIDPAYRTIGGANPHYGIVKDDFGQEVDIAHHVIHGFMLEDMDQSKLAHVEQGLHRARTQAKAQQMAAADPVLRTAAMAQGPAMLQPGFGGNGAFRGQ